MADPLAPYVPPPRRAGGCLTAALVGVAVVGALVVLGALGSVTARSTRPVAVGAGGSSPGAGGAAAPTSTDPGIATHSGNRDNPPPNDVAVTRCFAGGLGELHAEGTVLNHSSKTSNYAITVVWTANGGRVADGVTWVREVRPGESATWQAGDWTKAPAGFGCEVRRVDRWAA